ncbi:MAG: hypothetical protein M1814_000104 [Vezdaea aestivalis]|nr:MAG: hypothetical protein M1814_000104 [Vezdaea aestivalis]
MLGRLFSSAASTLNHAASSSPGSVKKNSPESVQEEIYTRSLLFPDSSLLNQPQSHIFPLPTGSSSVVPAPPSGFDCYGELDLESPRDVRIIVAQDDASNQLEKLVLYDSKPVTSPQARPSDPLRDPRLPWQPDDDNPTPLRPRSSGSGAVEPSIARRRAPPAPLDTSPVLGNGNPYQRLGRRTGLGSISSTQSKLLSQQRNELRTFLDCMFGSTPLAYKGPSTKLHVMPVDARPESRGNAGLNEAGGSFGRAEGHKRSHLAQSCTPNNTNIPPSPNSSISYSASSRHPQRRTILITRMFSVLMPNVSQVSAGGTVGHSAEAMLSSPFPSVRSQGGEERFFKQVKTPMFAISIIITLPVSRSTAPSAKSGSSSYIGPRLAGSFHENSPHSYEGDRRIGALDSFFGAADSFSISSSAAGDVDDGMETITQHWDVITRILSSLQTFVQAEIFRQLSKVELSSTPLNSSRSAAGNFTPHKKSAKANIQLPSGALMRIRGMEKMMDSTARRIILALRIPRVITGQGRWGVWRDEARWIGRWATSKEHNFFFFNVLTSFLGIHTGWLEILGPRNYRRQSRRLRYASASDEVVLTQRTVLVSTDKMAARRLIFLLSTFLPASQTHIEDGSCRRPATSTSLRGYSQSPPSGTQAREEPLRRAMSRRSGNRSYSRGHIRTMSFPMHEAVEEAVQEDGSKVTLVVPKRRSSDERSTKTIGVPIHRGSDVTRKSSVATTTTATPVAPIAHITGPRHEAVERMSMDRRRGSNSSLASMNLMQTLRRNDSNNVSNVSSDSQPASRWGSLISGFWSARRDSSTDNSDVVIVGADENGTAYKKSQYSGHKAENDRLAVLGRESFDVGGLSSSQPTPEDSGFSNERPENPMPSQDIPGRPKSDETPLKLSVDEKDGIIDVDIGLPFFSTSFGSPMSSPSTRGFLTLDGNRPSISQTSTCPFSQSETDAETHVAGWLKRFHADFTVQAVAPYDDLQDEIRAAMLLEPSNHADYIQDGEWHDASSTLLANAQTFTVKRIVLRRRKLAGQPVEEKFAVEPLFNMDDTLADAMEHVLALSGAATPMRTGRTASTGGTAASSRSSSRRRWGLSETEAGRGGEVPRGECKKIIVGALDEVARSVVAEVEEEEEAGVGRERERDRESTLREGVRKWVVGIRRVGEALAEV